MIIDKCLIFAEQATVTATGTSNVVDFQESGDAIGHELTLKVLATVTGTGTGTVTIALQSSSDNSTYATVVSSPAVVGTAAVAGEEIFAIKLPRGLNRYNRLSYTVSGTVSMTLSAFLVKEY